MTTMAQRMSDALAPPRWQNPRPSLDLDNEVESLIKTGLLRQGFEENPFLTARCYLGRAIALARNAECKRDALAATRSDLEKVEKRARTLKRGLQQLAEEAETLLSIPTTTGSETLEPEAELERRGAAARVRLPLMSNPRPSSTFSAVAAVQELEGALKAHRDDIPQRSEDAFRSAFIEEIAYCWVRLTAKVPTAGDEGFAAFVSAAHSTLGVTSPRGLDLPFHVEDWDPVKERARHAQISDQWGFQIKKTLQRMNRRPPHDRADRYERGFAAPAVAKQPSSVRRRIASTKPEFDEETKRLIKEMRAGSAGSRDAAQILLCEFQLAGRGLQRRYIDDFDLLPNEAQAVFWPAGKSWAMIDLNRLP